MIRKSLLLIIYLTVTLLISCNEDEQPKILGVEDIVGRWECIEANRTQCNNSNDNGPFSCEGNSRIFNSDYTCTIGTTEQNSFDGTFTFKNNILVLTLDLTDVPINGTGVEGATAGIVEFDPVEISISGDIMTGRPTIQASIDGCVSTSKFARVN